MKIYTKTGDKGQTSLLRGGRVAKHHPRVEVYGTFDELNSLLGVAKAVCGDELLSRRIGRLQGTVHILCSDLAADPAESGEETGVPRIREEHVGHLENEIDEMTGELPELTHFILPGGTQVGAALHHARTVCRRGERRLIEFAGEGARVSEELVRYVNRLSDYLFTLARWANHLLGVEETPWRADSKD
jgi:cob(I)alamin adenosyltransferase